MPPHPNRLNPTCSTLRKCCEHLPRRRFATSQRHLAPDAYPQISKYPPEHPKFIEVPHPIQPQAIPIRRIKGTLPVPRNLFPSGASSKATPEYLAQVTPEPLPRNAGRIPDARSRDLVNFKERQSEQRRQNLREGIVELHHRKQRVDRSLAARSLRKQALNHREQTAPEREDERLTNATVVQGNLPQQKMLIPDPQRAQNLALKRGNVVQSQAMTEQRRKDMLHTLYVNAGDFITTGKQLDQAIDKEFDDENKFSNDEKRGFNIWNLGLPETTAELLGNSGLAFERNKKAVSDPRRGLIEERMRRIGEELTGGKGS